jgi:hypothetical protein
MGEGGVLLRQWAAALALFFLDLLGALLGGRDRLLACLLATTVWWDPLGLSRAEVPLRGRRLPGAPRTFRVGWAPTERDRRAVAWLYLTCDAPGAAEWRACLRAFGLRGVPLHTLELPGAGGRRGPAAAVAVDLGDPASEGHGWRAVRLLPADGTPAPPPASGAIPLGGLSPERLLFDAFRG